jgi:hypothetical protein
MWGKLLERSFPHTPFKNFQKIVYDSIFLFKHWTLSIIPVGEGEPYEMDIKQTEQDTRVVPVRSAF